MSAPQARGPLQGRRIWRLAAASSVLAVALVAGSCGPETPLDTYPKTPVRALLDSLRAGGEEAGLLTRLGGAYFRDGDYGNAVASYEKSLALAPDNLQAKYQLAAAYGRLARFDEAIAVVEPSLRALGARAEHRAAELHNLLGFLHIRSAAAEGGVTNFRRDKMLAGLAAYERAVSLKPDKALYHYNLATAFDNLQRREEALAAYDRAIELYIGGDGSSPDGEKQALARAYANTGQMLSEQGESEQALVRLLAAIAIEPRNEEFQYHHGRVLIALDRLPEAEAAFRTALDLRPTYARARYALANLCLRTGRDAEGEQHMEAFRRLGGRGDTLSRLRAAVRRNPGNVTFRLALGSEYTRLGRFEEALEEYRIALAMDPQRGEIHHELGRLYVLQKDAARAVPALEEAARLLPKDVSVHTNLGALYLSSGRVADAVLVLERAARQAPEHPRLRYNLGMAYLQQGQLDSAGSQLRLAVAADSTYAQPLAALARIAARAGRQQEAEGYAERLRQLRQRSAPQPAPATGPATGEDR